MSAHRIVVVGHGMVAARFLDDLDRCATTTGSAFSVTVLGDEPYEPYNRLMLSEVVAGRADINALTLPAAPSGTTVHRGSAATEIDRHNAVVRDEHGNEHPYDTVVLATGSAARVPPIEGLEDPEHGLRGVRPLRTIDDCRELLATTSRVDHVTVLGGGLLGIEVACGLRTRNVDVTVIHLGPHLMERQLDETSGAIARHTLADLGMDVRTGAGIQRVIREDGRVTAVELTDGSVVNTDLIVLSAGVAPRTQLAQDAGLPTEHGVLVDLDLRSPADPAVAAIGDCAQTPDGCPGLLAPGWNQAHRLARQLCGLDDAPEAGSTGSDVVKLKAVGLEIVTLGAALPTDELAPGAPRVVSLVDARARRSVRVAVQDDRVIGAVCVGATAVAADLTVAFERRTRLPADPALLLVRGPAAGGVPTVQTPTAMPSSATVCRCNGVTKRAIVDAHICGDRSVAEVACRTRATTGCGGCTGIVQGLIDWMDEINPDQTQAPARALASPGTTQGETS